MNNDNPVWRFEKMKTIVVTIISTMLFTIGCVTSSHTPRLSMEDYKQQLEEQYQEGKRNEENERERQKKLYCKIIESRNNSFLTYVRNWSKEDAIRRMVESKRLRNMQWNYNLYDHLGINDTRPISKSMRRKFDEEKALKETTDIYNGNSKFSGIAVINSLYKTEKEHIEDLDNKYGVDRVNKAFENLKVIHNKKCDVLSIGVIETHLNIKDKEEKERRDEIELAKYKEMWLNKEGKSLRERYTRQYKSEGCSEDMIKEKVDRQIRQAWYMAELDYRCLELGNRAFCVGGNSLENRVRNLENKIQ